MQDTSQGIVAQVSEYVSHKVDSYKLALVEQLVRLSADIAGALIFALLGGIALTLSAVAFVLFLSYLLGSLIVALLIVAFGLVIIATGLYRLRHKLFSNSLVRLFISLIFDSRHEQ